jgi:hypothetical protein
MKIVSRKRNTQEYDDIKKKNVWKMCKLEKSSKFYALKVFQNYFLNSVVFFTGFCRVHLFF